MNINDGTVRLVIAVLRYIKDLEFELFLIMVNFYKIIPFKGNAIGVNVWGVVYKLQTVKSAPIL